MPVAAFSQLLATKLSINQVLGPYGWVFVASFLITALATPLCRAVAMRLSIVDKPDAFLKPHAQPVAYLGGVAIYLGWVAGMLVVAPFRPALHRWFLGIAIAGGIAMLVGLLDDLLDLKPKLKLLGQLAAGCVLLAFGVGLDFFHIFLTPLSLEAPANLLIALSIPLVLFLILGASNAANLLDGLDGLCSGVTGIIAVGFTILATHLAMYGHEQAPIVVSLAMFGAVCGFLPYNYNPANIFMGDAGSLLLGFYSASMMIMLGGPGPMRWVLGSIMIFGLPILDTSLALVRRIRLHRPIFQGDRSHLYDQLVDRGFTVKQTVIISYFLAGLYTAIGVVCSIFLRTRTAGIIYLAVAAATVILCWKWGFLTPHENAKPGDSEPKPADDAQIGQASQS